jgi:hypothetical protein
LISLYLSSLKKMKNHGDNGGALNSNIDKFLPYDFYYYTR